MLDDVKTRLEQCLGDYLRDLEQLVNIDSGTFLKAGVDEVADLLQHRYRRMGGDIRVHQNPTYGNTFVATFKGTGPGSALLIGHTDTVYPAGTAIARPYTSDGRRALGPGTADMKSGDLSIVYALEILFSRNFTDFSTITVIHNSDEELGSPSSSEIVRSHAKDADAVLVLEAGRSNGNIVSERKGVVDCRFHVYGRSAHAGVNHDEGRNAVLEMAYLVVALEGLNGSVPGATLNVGHVESAERINVVPDHAYAHFEVRAFDVETLQAMMRRVEEVIGRRTVPDTSVEFTARIEHHPMHKSADSERLVQVAKSLASGLGFSVEDMSTGGASDGNTAAAAGRPVLDGLGPVGGGAHTPDEYIEIDSIVPRTTMLAGLIATVGSGQW